MLKYSEFVRVRDINASIMFKQTAKFTSRDTCAKIPLAIPQVETCSREERTGINDCIFPGNRFALQIEKGFEGTGCHSHRIFPIETTGQG